MVGSSDFEKGLHHFGGEDGGSHLPSNWGMDESDDPYADLERHYRFQDAVEEAKGYAEKSMPHKIVRAKDYDDSWFVLTPEHADY